MTTTFASVATPEAMRRFVLRLDAVVSGANGVAYLALAGPLADLFGVSASLLRPIGAFLLVWAALLWLLSNRSPISRTAMITVADLNLVWVAGSIAFAVTGAASPDAAGTVWVVLQAIAVAGFAALQLVSARQS